MANKDNKKVFEKNMVFASLQTSTRLVELEDNYQFLLIDTVGFVQDLPTHLFKAFRSTLEEVLDADLLIQVIDSSDDQYEEHSKTTNAILQELGTDQIPMIYVYNKIDLNKYGNVYPLDPFVFISAKEKKNMDTLTKMITKRLFKDERYYKIKIPYEMGTDFTTISRTFHIISTKYLEDGMYLELACSPSRVHVFEKYLLIN